MVSMLSLIIGHIITPFILNPTLFGLYNYKYDIDDTPSIKSPIYNYILNIHNIIFNNILFYKYLLTL